MRDIVKNFFVVLVPAGPLIGQYGRVSEWSTFDIGEPVSLKDFFTTMEDIDQSDNCTFVLGQHPAIIPFWLTGIAVSTTSFLCQIGFFFFYPPCRKYDEKTLCMLSFARTMNSITELCIISGIFKKKVFDIILVIYFYWDFVLVCWMFVFSKNLYDKVVAVFNVTQYSLTKVSIIIYTFSIVPALPCCLIGYMGFNLFQIYYKTYACTKFILLITNSYIFVRIFHVTFKNRGNHTRNVTHIVKAAIVSFILLCMTSLQTFVVDVYALIGHRGCLVTLSFCVINSFQTLAMTIIFAVLISSKIRKSSRVTVAMNTIKNSSVATSCS